MDGTQIYVFLLLIGAVQGLVLGVMLCVGASPRRRANRFLGVLLFFLAYRLVAETLHALGYINPSNALYHVFIEYNWGFGTLLWFYVLAYLDSTFRLRPQHLVHAIPVTIEFLFSNFVKSQNFFWDGSRESLSWAGYWGYVLWMHTPFQIVVFCALIVYYVRRARRTMDAYLRTGAVVRMDAFRWLRRILALYALYACVAIVASVIDFVLFDYAFNPRYIYLTYGGLALITYWLALQGFAHREDPALRPKRRSVEDPQEDGLHRKLHHAMTVDALYRDPQLNLDRLAEALSIKPYQLTQLLNSVLNISFTEYVNAFRVMDVERKLKDPAYAHYTLLAIAFEAGFNSKASFNRIIKKMTGRPPSALRQRGREK